jgi:signal transduction histidine kinase/CheY-like chemotaxis protein
MREDMMTRPRALSFAVLAATASCAALGHSYFTGFLRLDDARFITAAAFVGVGLLLIAFIMLRRRTTAQEQRTEDLARLNARLLASESALTEARDRAEENSRAKSHFLATMSHEIRTPMNGVLGMARLLLETPLTPDQKTYAEAIRQSGLSLLALIEDILDFSKIESGALTLESSDVLLRPLIEGVAELLATRAHAKGIEIATAIDADVPNQIRADGMRLRQVLTNLIGNAVKFTEAGGVLITASLERDAKGAALIFSVRDTGIGVPPDKALAIFEDFVQADSSHARRFEGTGLGLAISRRLVTAMGGSIGVHPAEDHGSVFWVRLPLDEVQPRPAPPPLRNKRIGLANLSPVIAAGLKRQIAAAGGSCAEIARLDNSDAPEHDLILLGSDSERLPDMRALSVPVIALLSPAQRMHLETLGEHGIRGYLMKPVRQDSLEKRILAVLAGETELAPVPAAPAPAPPAHRPSELSILVAEDNPVNALLARELLRRRGHRVDLVITGEAAVEACAAKRFDLVLMDLHMPVLDGIDATLRIRSAEAETNAKPVAIFALTADAVETGRKACLAAGMDGFLTKPVDPADLDAVLATIHPAVVLAAE